MGSNVPPIRYQDPEYQQAHNDLWLGIPIEAPEHILPPGVTQEAFDKAIAEFVSAIGKEAVFTGEALRDYVDPYEIASPGISRKIPSAAVCPSTVHELQGVLKVANEYEIPVWTFSRGKNIGYGGPAPRLPGSVALDLHRMNKVLEVNEKFAYAVVEPGVTFTDLYQYCEANGLKVWPSVPSLGWGSVIGNVCTQAHIRQIGGSLTRSY